MFPLIVKSKCMILKGYLSEDDDGILLHTFTLKLVGGTKLFANKPGNIIISDPHIWSVLTKLTRGNKNKASFLGLGGRNQQGLWDDYQANTAGWKKWLLAKTPISRRWTLSPNKAQQS